MRGGRGEGEQILQWLRLRAEGLSSGVIAERFGVAPERVRVMTVRVARADAAESGEDVGPAYPWLGVRRPEVRR